MSITGRLTQGFAWLWPLLALACALPLVAVSLVSDRPLAGSVAVMVISCGLLLVPLLPRECWSPSIVLTALPGLGLGGYVVLSVSLSTAGITLTRLSLASALVVAALVVLAASWRLASAGATRGGRRWGWKTEAPVVVALVGVVVLSSALARLVIRGFPPVGNDWGNYLLYAGAVREHGRLDLVDPYWMGGGLPFANDAGGGALLGGLGRFDGLSDATLSQVIVVLFALMPLSTFAAVGALWGRVAGLVAALTLAVASQLRDILPWHGLSLTFALVLFPFLLLALGRAYRGHRDWATKGLLAFILVATAAVHRASAVLVGVVLITVFLVRLWRAMRAAETQAPLVGLRPRLTAWRQDAVHTVIVDGAVVAAVAGVLVLAHLTRQASGLGRPPAAKFFQTRFDLETFTHAYGRWLLGLAILALIVVLRRRRRLSDPALAALGVLTLGIVGSSLLWMVGVSWDYARAAYYVALPLAALIGVAAAYLPRNAWLLVCVPLLFVAVRPLTGGPEGADWQHVGEHEVAVLRAFGSDLREGGIANAPAVVVDTCDAFVVPYLVRVPTFAALEGGETVAGKDLAPAADARAILAGGPKSAALAQKRGIEYAVLNPLRCGEQPALGGRVVFSNPLLRIVRLETPAATD